MKNTTSLSLVVLASLTLAGCGGQTEQDINAAQQPVATVTTQERAQVSTNSAPSGVLSEPVTNQQAIESAARATTMHKQSALVIDGTPLSVDATDREAVRRFYNEVYLEPKKPMNWTGNHSTGSAGTINPEYQRATIQRVNWYRAMAGVPASVQLSNVNSSKSQQAAFMMSVNDALSHTPPQTWKSYTAEGAEGAIASNLALGFNGPDAVDAYMKDYGDNNFKVGHRRWLLFPGTKTFGTGDVPAAIVDGKSLWSANALWVTDVDFWGPRPQVRDGFVAWPTRGFVPYQTVFARWSFSYPAADFAQARVAVTRNGVPLDVRMETVANGVGENTLVWKMPDIDPNGRHLQPEADVKYSVTVSNVVVAQEVRSFTYDVTVFDTGLSPKGPYSAYTIVKQDTTLTLMDNRGLEGIQSVKNPVRVDFADLSLAFDIDGNAGKAYRLYRAAFNRKPDEGGLGFWITQLDRGLDPSVMARGFAQSPEFAQLYGTAPTHDQIVRTMYRNVLHREPDAGGYEFWMKILGAGHPVELVLNSFSESVENKAQVAGEINSGIIYKRYQ
jgi:hypothetical protein